MTYAYQSPIAIARVGLTVKDLGKLVAFYRDIIGLELISETGLVAHLGLGRQEFLTLIKGQNLQDKALAGLYHTAFLLPNRQALGDALYHLWETKTQLIGASDHGYSEAIYLEDPEGNGIEIYADRPVEVWERDDKGLPIGKTVPIDVQGVLEGAKAQEIYRLPEGSYVGHVHLSVMNALETTKAYQEVFPMEDKLTIPTASFIAGGDYHHHLAVNQWTRGLIKRTEGQLGLAYVVLKVSDPLVLTEIAHQATAKGWLKYAGETQVRVHDQINGILFQVELDNQ